MMRPLRRPLEATASWRWLHLIGTTYPLPTRDAVMKNKHNKRNLPSLLSICNLGPQVSV